MIWIRLTRQLVVGFFVIQGFAFSFAATWQRLKDDHFIVYYNFKDDTAAARQVLRKAEAYYDKIARQIGYARYANFWTWEDRVKIIIFPNQRTFVQNTRQPGWSRGYADRDSPLFQSRLIVTYRQEQDFLEGLLPHEIGHLILWDFVGFEIPLPLWFDEGVAQLQETNKKEMADHFLRPLVKKRQYIPLHILMRWDVRKEGDPYKVKVFYTQSVSLIDFLIKNYGSTSFGILCRNLKNGKSFEEALRSTYRFSTQTFEDLEKKWVEYLSR